MNHLVFCVVSPEVIAKLQKILGFVFRAEGPQAGSRGWSEAKPPVCQNIKPAPQGRGQYARNAYDINCLHSHAGAPSGLIVLLILPGVSLRSPPATCLRAFGPDKENFCFSEFCNYPHLFHKAIWVQAPCLAQSVIAIA